MRKLNYILRDLKVCHESYYDRDKAKRDINIYATGKYPLPITLDQFLNTF